MWPRFDGKMFKSVTQGAPDLANIPLLDAKDEPAPETSAAVTAFIAFVKATLGEAVSDVRASDRLTDSAVCLVASEGGPDRSLEKLLAGSGKVRSPRSQAGAGDQSAPQPGGGAGRLGDDENAFKEDAAQMLFDEARVLDGDRVADARALLRAAGAADQPRARQRPGELSIGRPTSSASAPRGRGRHAAVDGLQTIESPIPPSPQR